MDPHTANLMHPVMPPPSQPINIRVQQPLPGGHPAPAMPPSPPNSASLDPPFRGYIETTYDALLVFEAARRGMIPRVTRRLIERERGMVQSGAVFVFDEHESGIKRWTDGLIWSPSRILGNFLVYRQTDKRSNPNPPTTSDQNLNTQGAPGFAVPGSLYQSNSNRPGLSAASITGLDVGSRPRSISDSGKDMTDKNRERQLVGSLTSSYKFKEGGLVKKTMSVNVNGFAQHMISYYSVDDVLNSRLRTPSSIGELLALEISSEYLQKQNFRFPPVFELGPDGILEYKGEADEPQSPTSAPPPLSAPPIGGYGNSDSVSVYSRPSTAGIVTPMSPELYPTYQSSSASYFEQQQMTHMNQARPSTSVPNNTNHLNRVLTAPPLIRQHSDGGGRSSSAGQSKSRRYEPYGYSPQSATFPTSAKSPNFAFKSPVLPDIVQSPIPRFSSNGNFVPNIDYTSYDQTAFSPTIADPTSSTMVGFAYAPIPTDVTHGMPGQQDIPRPSSGLSDLRGSDMGRSFSNPTYPTTPATVMPPSFSSTYNWIKPEEDTDAQIHIGYQSRDQYGLTRG